MLVGWKDWIAYTYTFTHLRAGGVNQIIVVLYNSPQFTNKSMDNSKRKGLNKILVKRPKGLSISSKYNTGFSKMLCLNLVLRKDIIETRERGAKGSKIKSD